MVQSVKPKFKVGDIVTGRMDDDKSDYRTVVRIDKDSEGFRYWTSKYEGKTYLKENSCVLAEHEMNCRIIKKLLGVTDV